MQLNNHRIVYEGKLTYSFALRIQSTIKNNSITKINQQIKKQISNEVTECKFTHETTSHLDNGNLLSIDILCRIENCFNYTASVSDIENKLSTLLNNNDYSCFHLSVSEQESLKNQANKTNHQQKK